MSGRDGGPAFPRPFSWDVETRGGTHMGDRPEPHPEQDGMTLRQWYAGKALQALAEVAAQGVYGHKENRQAAADELADACFAIADAMIRRGKL